MSQVEYRGVNLPSDLIEKVERIITEGKLGYVSVSEFVKDATRQHVLRFVNNNSGGGDERKGSETKP